PALFDTTFAWPGGRAGAPGAVAVAAPDWVPGAAARLPQGRGEDLRAAPPDTTAWLALSRQMHAGVKLAPVGPGRGDGSIQLGDQMPLDGRVFAGRKAVYRDVSADPAFWEEWRYFGGALVDIHRWRGGNVDEASLLLSVRTGWIDLRSEFLEGENNLNVAAVAAMGAVAFLFLVIEIFALFFGVRITEGIIAAVRTLGRGAKAVAGGDLETVIEVPNEDEFGDLAANFNEMIRAVKKGREDALARERLTREVQTAREIQDRLLPHGEPELPGFEITGCSLPSREIGGDYFDFIIQADDRVGLAIADVSGKGMPAALLMANLQASLHGQAMRRDGVAHVVSRVNDQLTASTDPHMFATFFYAELDTRTGLLTSTNAGHNPPVVVRADGAVETLGEGGLLIGMLPDQPYAQQETLLGPGDVVVLYTDGITEAAGPSAEPDDPSAMFGDDELVDVVRRHAHLPAVGIKEALLAAVARHTAGVEQSDDITLVVIRRKG
ncbi:MAG TPA: SpoIIE family protein phosphatase, partial [Candidatus Krumholzibacteria bacterium]|nr:SpoIIE family protein phosphatase [Candidatus Krumholzibacteria bacterium]